MTNEELPKALRERRAAARWWSPACSPLSPWPWLGSVRFGTTMLGPMTSFMPAMLAAVACFDVISQWLLAAEYGGNGDRRTMAPSWAYVWSLVDMTGYAFAFPGVISAHPSLALATTATTLAIQAAD